MVGITDLTITIILTGVAYTFMLAPVYSSIGITVGMIHTTMTRILIGDTIRVITATTEDMVTTDITITTTDLFTTITISDTDAEHTYEADEIITDVSTEETH